MRIFSRCVSHFAHFYPMHMHWLEMFERFCVSLQNHPIRAPCHSWVFLSSLLSLLSCFRYSAADTTDRNQSARPDSKHRVALPVRVPYQRTAVFSQLPCPSLRCWLHRLKSAVSSVLQEDRSRGKSSTAHVNTFPMIRWVFTTHP